MTEAFADEASFEHHFATLNQIRYHFVTCGSGPAVLFCHGFPDLWRGWRHQMRAVAEAGFTAVAPDLRGFGETDAPSDVEHYTSLDVLGDLTALLDHLGFPTAVVVGHDWGASIAQTAALVRPDRFTALVTLSVPWTPRGSASLPAILRAVAPADLYFLYFLEPGRAEQELDAQPAEFIRRLIYTNSGKLPGGAVPSMQLSAGGRLIDGLLMPPAEMTWFDEHEVALYAQGYARGFRGALNTYRSLERSWALTAPWADKVVETPVLYIGGDRDIVLSFPGMRDAVINMVDALPKAREPVLLADTGHFLQFEQPESVNRHLLGFLQEVA